MNILLCTGARTAGGATSAWRRSGRATPRGTARSARYGTPPRRYRLPCSVHVAGHVFINYSTTTHLIEEANILLLHGKFKYCFLNLR